MKNTKRVKEELLSQADGEKTMDETGKEELTSLRSLKPGFVLHSTYPLILILCCLVLAQEGRIAAQIDYSCSTGIRTRFVIPLHFPSQDLSRGMKAGPLSPLSPVSLCMG